jgi:hypothetical protein
VDNDASLRRSVRKFPDVGGLPCRELCICGIRRRPSLVSGSARATPWRAPLRTIFIVLLTPTERVACTKLHPRPAGLLHPRLEPCPASRGGTDGGKIVFTRHLVTDPSPIQSNTAEVCVLTLDTLDVECVTQNSLEERAPTWSPDGTKIAHGRRRPRYRLRDLRDERGRLKPDAADFQRGVRRDALVVTRWPEDRVRQGASNPVPASAVGRGRH